MRGNGTFYKDPRECGRGALTDEQTKPADRSKKAKTAEDQAFHTKRSDPADVNGVS